MTLRDGAINLLRTERANILDCIYPEQSSERIHILNLSFQQL